MSGGRHPRIGIQWLDPNAAAYIAAVEAADGQALEGGTRNAINNLVLGIKGISGMWGNLTFFVPLAGPRTLNGLAVPLKGPQSIVFTNFTGANYDRKNGITKDAAQIVTFTSANFVISPAGQQAFGYLRTASYTVTSWMRTIASDLTGAFAVDPQNRSIIYINDTTVASNILTAMSRNGGLTGDGTGALVTDWNPALSQEHINVHYTSANRLVLYNNTQTQAIPPFTLAPTTPCAPWTFYRLDEVRAGPRVMCAYAGDSTGATADYLGLGTVLSTYRSELQAAIP
jgi:hypothetical protein